jgi:predicted RNase H-like HicB family nuclease
LIYITYPLPHTIALSSKSGGVMTYTAVICKEDEWYVAECPETGTVSQGHTIEEAIANLREATELYVEEFAPPVRQPPFLTTFEVPAYA